MIGYQHSLIRPGHRHLVHSVTNFGPFFSLLGNAGEDIELVSYGKTDNVSREIPDVCCNILLFEQ